MKSTTKTKTLELFLKILEENHPEISEATRRKTAYLLCDASMDVLHENCDGLSKSMLDAVVNLEKYKTVNLWKENNKTFASFKPSDLLSLGEYPFSNFEENQLVITVASNFHFFDSRDDKLIL